MMISLIITVLVCSALGTPFVAAYRRAKRRERHREIANALERWACSYDSHAQYEVMAAVAALRGEL